MEELKQELKKLIARDRVKQALRKMAELPEDQKGGMGGDVIALQQRLSKYTRESRMNLLDSRDASKEKNQIVHAVLGIIEELGTEVIAPAPVQSTPTPVVDATTKILFLAANPTNTGQLRLGQEHREVEQSLRESSVREKFELTERFAVTSKSLFTALLDENPAIVHFSGHGEMMRDDSSPENTSSEKGFRSLMAVINEDDETDMEGYTGGIVVEDNSGKAKLVKADALATLFGNISGIKCVILNACYSESQAKAILEQIPYVIGMNTAVPDKTAIMFATGFYRALGNGRDYENAFNLAKSLIEIEGLKGADIPVIHINQSLTE